MWGVSKKLLLILEENAPFRCPLSALFLQTFDVVHQVAYRLKALGLAELNAALVFQVADELYHVQGSEDIVPDFRLEASSVQDMQRKRA